MSSPAAGIIGAVAGVGMAIGGGIKSMNNRPEDVMRPIYKIDSREFDMENLLKSLAGNGLPDATKNYYNQNASRALSSNLSTILQGGGDMNNAGFAYQDYLDNQSKLAVADDQARLQNISMLVDQQRRLSDREDQKWKINEYAKFVDEYQRKEQRRREGMQTAFNGIGTAVNAIGGIGEMSGGGSAAKTDNNTNTGSTAPEGASGVTARGTENSNMTNNWGTTYDSKTGAWISNNSKTDKLTADDYTSLKMLLGR